MNSHQRSTVESQPQDKSLTDTLVDFPAIHPAPQSEDTIESSDSGETVLQHLVRIRDAEGRESIHATLRGELAAGERFTTLFVGFCPPFACLPRVEAEVMEGPAAVCKVTQTLHHGAQIDVELDTVQNETAVITVEAVAIEVVDPLPASQR